VAEVMAGVRAGARVDCPGGDRGELSPLAGRAGRSGSTGMVQLQEFAAGLLWGLWRPTGL